MALLAKVSRGTVSNVLNHPHRVSPARREAVQAAIDQLGFVRHEGARHLRAGYSNTIGLLLLDAWNPGFIDVAHGVEDTTVKQGLSVLIANSARSSDREASYLRLYTERRVAGLIVVPHDHLGGRIKRLRAGGIPVVIVDQADTSSDPAAMSVSVDDFSGGLLAAQHLIELGHTRIGFAGDPSSAIPVQQRYDGAQNAVAAHSGVELSVLRAELTVDSGRRIGNHLARLSPGKRPTALIAAVDLIAFGVMQGLLQHGVQVPDDVSIVGYDDIPFARQLSVPLTTVNRPHYLMGTTAADLLNAAIHKEPLEVPNVVFEPTLVVRESTSSPRA